MSCLWRCDCFEQWSPVAFLFFHADIIYQMRWSDFYVDFGKHDLSFLPLQLDEHSLFNIAVCIAIYEAIIVWEEHTSRSHFDQFIICTWASCMWVVTYCWTECASYLWAYLHTSAIFELICNNKTQQEALLSTRTVNHKWNRSTVTGTNNSNKVQKFAGSHSPFC